MLTTHGMGKTRVSYYAVQASWLLLGLCLISAGPGVALTQYAVGQIPDQTAYHGYTRSFEVYVSDSPSGATFSMTAAPQPAGEILLDPATGVFSYTPGPEDREPFGITFTAEYPGGSAAQSIVMTPEISPMPEADAFEYVQSEPDATGYTTWWPEETVQDDVELNDILWTPGTDNATHDKPQAAAGRVCQHGRCHASGFSCDRDEQRAGLYNGF